MVPKDIPPFVRASGNFAQPHGINAEGLKRRGFSPETIARIRRAYKTLYRSGLTLEEAREALAKQAADSPEITQVVEFLGLSQRGIIR